MRVLGVDPGLGVTGFSILEQKRSKTFLLAYGTIRPKSKDVLSKRLNYLFEELMKVIEQLSPEVLAIEDSFYSKNVKSAMTLGQARAALILSASQCDLPIYEYAPKKVKMSVSGNGMASKEQISYMVSQILKLEKTPKPYDITDSIAVAICFLNQQRFL